MSSERGGLQQAWLPVQGNPGPSATEAAGAGSCPVAPASSRGVGSGPGFSVAFCSALLWGKALLEAGSSSSPPLAGSVAFRPFPVEVPFFPSSFVEWS